MQETNELIVPTYFGSQDYCQMIQETECKKNGLLSLKMKAFNKGKFWKEKNSQCCPISSSSNSGIGLFHDTGQGKMPPLQVCSARDSDY